MCTEHDPHVLHCTEPASGPEKNKATMTFGHNKICIQFKQDETTNSCLSLSEQKTPTRHTMALHTQSLFFLSGQFREYSTLNTPSIWQGHARGFLAVPTARCGRTSSSN